MCGSGSGTGQGMKGLWREQGMWEQGMRGGVGAVSKDNFACRGFFFMEFRDKPAIVASCVCFSSCPCRGVNLMMANEPCCRGIVCVCVQFDVGTDPPLGSALPPSAPPPPPSEAVQPL